MNQALINRYIVVIMALTTSPTQTVRQFARSLVNDMAEVSVLETLAPLANLPLAHLTPFERLVRNQVGATA